MFRNYDLNDFPEKNFENVKLAIKFLAGNICQFYENQFAEKSDKPKAFR